MEKVHKVWQEVNQNWVSDARTRKTAVPFHPDWRLGLGTLLWNEFRTNQTLPWFDYTVDKNLTHQWRHIKPNAWHCVSRNEWVEEVRRSCSSQHVLVCEHWWWLICSNTPITQQPPFLSVTQPADWLPLQINLSNNRWPHVIFPETVNLFVLGKTALLPSCCLERYKKLKLHKSIKNSWLSAPGCVLRLFYVMLCFPYVSLKQSGC